MAAFFSDVLDKFLTTGFLKKVCERFHYEERYREELAAVAEKMLPFLQKEAFWERKESFLQQKAKTGDSDMLCEDVVMSLGEGLDRLQEYYERQGLLSESYMAEALAGELLMQGYDAYSRYMERNTGYHAAAYHFPGSEKEFPLELLPEMLKGLTSEVSCNAAFCMTPKKSTVFVAELTRDKKTGCKRICDTCGKTDCMNRMKANTSAAE